MDHSLPLQGGEVGFQIFTQLLILLGVGNKNTQRCGRHTWKSLFIQLSNSEKIWVIGIGDLLRLAQWNEVAP